MSDGVEDLAKLDSIDPDVVLKTLETRHINDKIYTRNGAVLIAINPYKQLSIYSNSQLKLYKASMSLELVPPHIYAVAATAHRAMISGGRNQAVIISGESGSGKTESASFLLRYLRFVSNATDTLEHRIASASPLTEAFGCAKTIRNDNSSRFGKFLMLQFDQSARIQGARMSTYLLEKSRVTHINPGERSYHIFYCLLRAADASLRSRLQLASADPSVYRYLRNGETEDPTGTRTDQELFVLVDEALAEQGFSEETIHEIWVLLAGILHLGSVVFDHSRPEAAVITPPSKKSLDSCEQMLGIRGGALSRALTKRKIKAGKEFVEQELGLVAANDNRDALAKAIYSKLFDRIIEQINTAFSAGGEMDEQTDARTIGIVDIFGFEVFKLNSLEQLCINFANEKLQALFTRAVFKETIRAYEEDGIDAAEITFTDNAELLKIFELPQTGLLNILTEECLLPKGTDTAFCEKLHSAQARSSALTTVKGSSTREAFGIEHFAGLVNYSTKSWLDKNKDPLNGDLVVLMQFSDNSMLKELFSTPDKEPIAGRKFKSTKFKGVIDTFRAQLADLMGVLETSELHFVRCFKPNDEKRSDFCDESVISRQLHTSGVLDALRVARTGFPDRMPFDEFFSTFSAISKGRSLADMEAMSPKKRCEALLSALQVQASHYKLGRERVFLGLGVLAKLRTQRIEAMAAVTVLLQAGARGLAARFAARALKRARQESLTDLLMATEGDNFEVLEAAIAAARKVRVDQMVEGQAAFARALQRLRALQEEAKARQVAKEALQAALELHDLPRLRSALQTAVDTKVEPVLINRGQLHLKTLQEEQRRRHEEEERRRQEETRLASLAKKEKVAAERALAEERKKREAEEKRVAQAAAAEEADLAARLSQEASLQGAAVFDEVDDEEEVAQRAIEEEARLRQQVLLQLEHEGVSFQSETEDVLEYAVYLGMLLTEDLGLLWIADKALQAEDPDGWDQYESPNGDLYYMHEVTKQVLWQHPLDYQYQQLYLEEKKKLSHGRAPTHLFSPDSRPVAPSIANAQAAALAPPPPSVPIGAASDDQLRALLQHVLGTRYDDLRSLLTEPACCQEPVRCFVVRHKSRMAGGRFDFFMSISRSEDMYCFTAKKHSAAKGCYYSISLDQDETKRSKASSSDSFIGKVRSDRRSSEYILYDDGNSPDSKEAQKGGPIRRELLYVNFVNSLRNRNPGVMQVVVPDVIGGKAVQIQPNSAKETLAERLKRAELKQLALLKNREPKWNSSSNMYQLDFHGRASLPSCKNIQLHLKEGDPTQVSFLMGKVEENKFNVDFKGPFSCLQAFAFALVVFDNSSGI